MKDGVFAKAPEIALARSALGAAPHDAVAAQGRIVGAAGSAVIGGCRSPCSRSGRSPTTRALFVTTLLNGLTLAALYFLVASGFTLVFGLMRNVNLAHGSLYLLGAYVGWVVGEHTGSWLLAVAAGFLLAAAGRACCCRSRVFRFMQGEDLRQTLVTIGLSIVLADLMLWIFGGEIYTFDPPRWIYRLDRAADGRQVPDLPAGRAARMAIVIGVGLWWFLARTRVGMMIRAGVDDRGDARGLRRQRAAACSPSPSRSAPAWRASPAWSAARRCRSRRARTRATCSPRWSWSSSAAWAASSGAAIGALLIGLAEQFGLAYAPTYGVVFTFVIMVLVLAFRPRGILGRRA